LDRKQASPKVARGKGKFFKTVVYRDVILKDDGLLSGRPRDELCLSLPGLVPLEKMSGGIVANVPLLCVGGFWNRQLSAERTVNKDT